MKTTDKKSPIKELVRYSIGKDDFFYIKFNDMPIKTDVIVAFLLSEFYKKSYGQRDFLSRNGKLYLKDRFKFFSLSNKKDTAVVIFSNKDIGIDMEIVQKKPNYLKIAEKYFYPDETNYLRKAPNDGERLNRFYAIWTKKEAYVKLSGKGLPDLRKINTTKKNISTYKIGDIVFSVAKEL